MNRRTFLAASATACALPAIAADRARQETAAILARIHAPQFPSRVFDIAAFGARADGKTLNTRAIAGAISACHAAGGGSVRVPAGAFLTGAIHLKSNVNLHLDAAAILRFSRQTEDYLPVVFTRFGSIECMNYSPFVYALGQSNIAITGEGTLDGQASNSFWWPWKGNRKYGWTSGAPHELRARRALSAFGEQDVPVEKRVFGAGHYLRPPFIQPVNCTSVLVEGVTILNSPMWEINPVLCRNVIVRNVKINSHGPNNDGCDPECSSDVLIDGCLFDTGDDCIAIKSGRNRDGRRVNVPCENVIIRACNMKDGHGGVTIGSEVSGNVRNVFVENCRMDSPLLGRALRIKTNSQRGGIIENVSFRNVTIGQVSDAIISVDFYYEEGAGGPCKPVVRDIAVENVTCRRSRYALYLRGYDNAPIRDLRLKNCTFENVAETDVTEHVEGLRQDHVLVNGRFRS
jgi:polygalacturonase